MVKLARLRLWPVLPILAAILLVSPRSARGARIDIDDPSVLGPVRFSVDVGGQHSAHWISEVRFADGIYSYVYAIQTSPTFPSTLNQMTHFAVLGEGGPLFESTWGAIHGSDEAWPHDGLPVGRTNQVARISLSHHFFGAVPVSAPEFTYTVIYAQSLQRPGRNGFLSYVAHGEGASGEAGADGLLLPAPEPGTIVLFGSGLALLAGKRRTISRRLSGRTRQRVFFLSREGETLPNGRSSPARTGRC
jgi:PEP-CTERM motif